MRFFVLVLLALGIAAGSAPAQDSAKAPGLARATFAGGCFWCMEEAFEPIDGVVSVVSGYIGGRAPSPTYEQVSAGGTGHAEAVEIRYDPAKVSYDRLLQHFWRNIDPLAVDRQFCDGGDQYRSAIFYHDAGAAARRRGVEGGAREVRHGSRATIAHPDRRGRRRSMPPRSITRTITARIPSATSSTSGAAAAPSGWRSSGAGKKE